MNLWLEQVCVIWWIEGKEKQEEVKEGGVGWGLLTDVMSKMERASACHFFCGLVKGKSLGVL